MIKPDLYLYLLGIKLFENCIIVQYNIYEEDSTKGYIHNLINKPIWYR